MSAGVAWRRGGTYRVDEVGVEVIYVVAARWFSEVQFGEGSLRRGHIQAIEVFVQRAGIHPGGVVDQAVQFPPRDLADLLSGTLDGKPTSFEGTASLVEHMAYL